MSNVADFARSEQSFDQWSSGHQDVDAVCAPDEAKDHRADGQGRAEANSVTFVAPLCSEATSLDFLKVHFKDQVKTSKELLLGLGQQ